MQSGADWLTSITQNLAANAVWYVLTLLGGAIFFVLKKWLPNWLAPALYALIGMVLFGAVLYSSTLYARWPLATPLILVASLIIAAGLHLASVLIERSKKPNDTAGIPAFDHSACQETIRELEATIRKLQLTETVPVIESDINIQNLIKLVGVESGEFNLELDNLPFVEFIFTVFNAHVGPISVQDAVGGRAKYNDQLLEKEPYISFNEATKIEYGTSAVFKLRQSLTKDECDSIRRYMRASPNAFQYTEMDVREVSVNCATVKGESIRLPLPDRLKLPFATPVQLAAVEDIQKPCPSKWLHTIAENDRTNINYAVKVRGIHLQNAIDQGKRYIDLKIVFFNKSVFEVSIDPKLEGDIIFGSEVLITEKRVDVSGATNCLVRGNGVVIIRQYLDVGAIEDIKNSPEETAFRFNALYVWVKVALPENPLN